MTASSTIHDHDSTEREVPQRHLTANDLAIRPPIEEQLTRLKQGALFCSGEILTLWQQLRESPVGSLDLETVRKVKDLALGARLQHTPTFGLQIRDNTLQYCDVPTQLSEEELNPTSTTGLLFKQELFGPCIATVKDPKLMSPHGGIAGEVSERVLDSLILHEKALQRVTRLDTPYGALVTTTHSIVDGDAWAPNIDTVYGVRWLTQQMEKKNRPVSVTAEVGCGSALHSIATLAVRDRLNALKEWKLDKNKTVHTITDISAGAVNAGRRNVTPYLNGTTLEWFLGKGVSRLPQVAAIDFGVCNPPYLPHPDGRDSVDRYAGTGLIKELFEYLPLLLNPHNPEAAFYVQASNLTDQDIKRYATMYPQVKLTQVSEEVEVPLRIYSVKNEPDWTAHLKSCGLIDYSGHEAPPLGQPYWHKIKMWELKLNS